MHYGESFSDSIAKEATRRYLTPDYKAKVLCPINIRYIRDNSPVVHRPGILWHLEYDGPLAERETDNGRSFWIQKSNATHVLPEVSEGLRRLSDAFGQPIDMTWSL